jgi:uncharacterized protein YcbX
MPTLSQLLLYPIKSCAGMAVQEATLLESGLVAQGVHDREWMLVTEGGQFLTQREFPRMALIQPRPSGGNLRVRAPGMAHGIGDLLLPLAWDAAADGPLRTVRIWEDAVRAVDCGELAADWFTEALGTRERVRLVRFHHDVVRPTSVKWTAGVPSQTRFADGYPLLLIGQSSLDDLNLRLRAAGRASLPMDRFRPNLVVEGLAAFEEDYVAALSSGAAEIRPVKPCARCPIPAIDQATGVPGPDPLDILQTYRANPRMDGAVCMGMNCIVSAGVGSVLRVGQEMGADLAF